MEISTVLHFRVDLTQARQNAPPARSAPVAAPPPTNASRRSQPRAFPRIPTTTPAGEPASSRLRSPRPSRPRPLPIHRSPHGRGPLCARRRPAPHERVAAIATPCLPTHPHTTPAGEPASSRLRSPRPSRPRPLPIHRSPHGPGPLCARRRPAPHERVAAIATPCLPTHPHTTPAGEPASSRLRSPRPSRPRPLPIHRSPHGPGPLCARRRPAPHERVAAIATPCLPTHPHHDPCRRARQFTSPFSPSLPSQTPPNPSLPARPRPALRPSSSCPPRTRRGDRNPVPSHASPPRPLPASPPVHVSVLPVPPVPDPSQSIAPRTAPARSAPVVVLPPTNASRRSQPRAFPRIPTRPLPASPPVHVSVLPVPPVPDPSQSIAPRTGAARSAPVVVLPPTNASRRSQPRAFPRIPTTTPAGEPASSRLRSPRPSRPRPLPIHRSPHGRGPLCTRRRPAPHERVAAIATPCLPTHPHHDPCRRARQFTSPFSPSLPSQTPPNPSLPARPRPALHPSSSCPPRTRRGDRNPVPSHASPPRPLPASPPVHVSVLPVPPVPDPSQSIAPRTAPARSAPVVVLPPTNASRRSQPRAFPRIPTTTPAGEPASSRLRSPRPSRPRPLPIHRSPHGPGPLCARRPRPPPTNASRPSQAPLASHASPHDPCRRSASSRP